MRAIEPIPCFPIERGTFVQHRGGRARCWRDVKVSDYPRDRQEYRSVGRAWPSLRGTFVPVCTVRA